MRHNYLSLFSIKVIFIVLGLLGLSSSSALVAQAELSNPAWKLNVKNQPVSTTKDIKENKQGDIFMLTSDEEDYSLITIIRREGEIARELFLNKKKRSAMRSIAITQDNRAVVVGYTEHTGDRNGWIMLVDLNGDIVWEREIGGKRDDEFSDVIITEDNYCIVAGATDSGSDSKGNAWLLKIDMKGNVDWQKEYGSDHKDIVNTLVTLDGKYFMAGKIKKRSHENAFVMAINEAGEQLWNEVLADETNILNGITTFDGRLAFAGYIYNSTLEHDAWVIKMSPENGKTHWAESYGNIRGDDYGYDIIELLNGKMMVVGKSYSHRPGAAMSKIWNITINDDDGAAKNEPRFFKGNKESSATVIFYANNRDIILGGQRNEEPFITRYHTEIAEPPTITWEEIDADYKIVDLTDENAFLEVEAKVVSPVLLNTSEIKFYLDKNICINKKYYENMQLSRPAISTDGDRKFLYTIKNKIPVNVNDSLLEMRLYSNLFSVRSKPFRFKVVKQFRLDMVWFEPHEANTSSLARTVKNNNVTIKLMVFSSEPLSKDNFQVVINGRRTEGAKYGETVIKPFKKAEKIQPAAVYRYNYINNVFLYKGRNEIELEITINGVTRKSPPLIRNYNGEDGDFAEIKVDTTFDANLTNLHVLAIGVQHSDLKYTAKDAEDIAAAFQELGKKDLFKAVNVEVLSGREATKTNIDIALERYKNAYRIGDISRNDLLVVFISSHGFIYKDSIAGTDDWIAFEKFMIQASNYDNAAQQATSVAYENIIANLAAIRCKKIVMVDACFSGGVKLNKSAIGSFSDNESINDLIKQLSYQQPGLVTITSSTQSQPSYEDDTWENGAFTEAILEAFAQGDITNDGVVTLSELFNYINRRIPNLVQEKKQQSQKPTITNYNLGKIPLFKVE